MSLTLRDVRVLRDALLADDDLGYAAGTCKGHIHDVGLFEIRKGLPPASSTNRLKSDDINTRGHSRPFALCTVLTVICAAAGDSTQASI
jgi:hypothetical protein